MRRGDGDGDARVADLADTHAMRDRDRTEVVACGQLRREVGHHVLGHALVGLVLESDHLPPARLRAHCADEGDYGSRALVLHLGHDRGEVDRMLGEAKGSAGDRRDERDFVPLGEATVALGVGPVDREDEPGRLLPELESGPDVPDAGPVAELELVLPGARMLAQAGEKPHRHSHGR
jgi:hypothetical protein